MKLISFTLIVSGFFILFAGVNRKNIKPVNHFNYPSDSIEERFNAGSVEMGISTVISGLSVPWDLAWAADNTIIFSEQAGTVSKVNTVSGQRKVLLQIPGIWRRTTSGLLGLAIHPDFGKNPYVVVDYTVKSDSLVVSKLVRYTYTGDTLTQPLNLLEVRGGTAHNGSRVTITPDGKVFWATGDAVHAETAQNKDYLNGKILRLNIDGTIPSDNPFKNNPVWSSGYRNMQGLVFASNQRLYTSEHGEAIDDEINLITKNGNYGWPQVAGFCDTEPERKYCDSTPIVEPLKSWTPTIAPAGIEYYDNAAIPEWQNALLLTTLKENDFRVLKLNKAGTAIESETILFKGKFGRLRDVCISPSGDVYLATSNRDWNPSPGFPKERDDRIIRLFKIRTLITGNKPTAAVNEKKITAKETASRAPGLLTYEQYCSSCHKPNGKGVAGTFPPLDHSKRVAGDKKGLIGIVLNGMKGPVKIKGIQYDQQMPSFSFLTDKQLADVLTYVRTHFGNKASAVTREEVKLQRNF
jgi:aldose sugar dehydrogenase